MKHRVTITTAIALSLASQLVCSGAITDTYTTGDTLTTTTLNNIKSAVNDTGNSSAGDLTINAATNWATTPPANPNFDNILIEAGQTLTVPAGTTIRCAGGFVNNGTLLVTGGVEIGSVTGIQTGTSPTSGDHAYAHPGDSYAPASLGYVDNTAVNVAAASMQGGRGGKPIPQVVAMTSHDRFKFGGGSGAGYDNQGGHGGGLVRIQCAGAIVNTGTIDAQGFDGTNDSIGGGGGGIVILHSGSTIDNTGGVIDVSGGNGDSNNFTWGGNGGGGGGGIIVLISTGGATLGTETISGGLGGAGTTTLTSQTRRSGGGGGASGGAGGSGGSVGSTGVPTNGLDGDPGYVINITQ